MRKIIRVALLSMMFTSPAALAAQDMPQGMPEGMPEPAPAPPAEPMPGMTDTPADQTATSQPAIAMSPEQQILFDSWPPEQQAMFNSWPESQRVYYWTLAPEQQSVYFRLSDKNRADLDMLDEAGRMKAWESINAQLSGAPPPALAAPTESMPPAQEAEPMPEPGEPR